MSEAGPILERYKKLSQYVGLNLLDLEHCFQVTPNAIQEAGELVAAADMIRDQAKNAVLVAMAEAGERMRLVLVGGKEPSQVKIDSMMPLDPEVQAAKQVVSTSTYEADLCAALFRALETQARLLGKAADMVVSGYLTPTALNDQRRAQANDERQRARENMRRRRDDEYGDDDTR